MVLYMYKILTVLVIMAFLCLPVIASNDPVATIQVSMNSKEPIHVQMSLLVTEYNASNNNSSINLTPTSWFDYAANLDELSITVNNSTIDAINETFSI